MGWGDDAGAADFEGAGAGVVGLDGQQGGLAVDDDHLDRDCGHGAHFAAEFYQPACVGEGVGVVAEAVLAYCAGGDAAFEGFFVEGGISTHRAISFNGAPPFTAATAVRVQAASTGPAL
ncbi:hypothetical protein [Streptomyces sp. CS090A]|uniref:hypothetical protein n=1 Tax=Streptomyces sp. CS090A TaxID=2162710 RepID=UPI0013A58A62|nr:hypothetical protein [Streptomyces sp. CS090A]